MKELLEIVLNRGHPNVMNSTTDAWKEGRVNCRVDEKRPVDIAHTKISDADTMEMSRLRNKGETWAAIARVFGCDESTVRRKVNGRRPSRRK